MSKLFHKSTLLVAILIVLAGGLLLAAETVPMEVTSAKTEVRQILNDLETKMRKIESMQTKFSQTKKMSLFQHEVKLSGMLSMEKPEHLAWHTQSPVHYSIIFENDKMYQWDEDTQHVQVFTFSDSPVLKTVIEQMRTWFYGSYVALLDQYDIQVLSKKPLSLKFVPHKEVLSAAVIKEIAIWFREDESYIESILIFEKNGDQSQLTFTDTVLNAKVDPAVWEVNHRAI